jgi:hypothetical protein
VSDFRCRLNRSMQHHSKHCFYNASQEEPICFVVLAQNLARVVFRLA